MRRIYALALLPVLALGACATSPGGKPVISAAAAASDLNQGAAVIALASALYATTPNANLTVEQSLGQAQTALAAVASSLSTSGTTSGDLQANIDLANSALNAAIAGVQTVDPAVAAKMVAFRAAVLAALTIYNADAPAAGLPVIHVPA